SALDQRVGRAHAVVVAKQEGMFAAIADVISLDHPVLFELVLNPYAALERIRLHKLGRKKRSGGVLGPGKPPGRQQRDRTIRETGRRRLRQGLELGLRRQDRAETGAHRLRRDRIEVEDLLAVRSRQDIESRRAEE